MNVESHNSLQRSEYGYTQLFVALLLGTPIAGAILAFLNMNADEKYKFRIRHALLILWIVIYLSVVFLGPAMSRVQGTFVYLAASIGVLLFNHLGGTSSVPVTKRNWYGVLASILFGFIFYSCLYLIVNS